MKRLIAAAVTVVLAACGGGVSQTDKFKNGVPSQDAVKMNVPASKGAPLSGSSTTRQDGLEGDTAIFYSFTRGVSVTVNAATVAVLTLVEKITQYPATSVNANVAIWGPYTDALSPNTWKLTVTETAADHYQYVLEGKAKTEADSAYRVVLSGSHVSTGDKVGSGSFLIDWDQSKQLPENDGNVGTVAITYSKTSLTAPGSVEATFHQVKDAGAAKLIDATYAYTETPGQGGTLQFSLDKDLVPGAAIEHVTVRSRWLQSGAGRSDVHTSGGDLVSTVAAVNECWDSNFASRYFAVSYDAAQNYGAETVCAFASAEYAAP